MGWWLGIFLGSALLGYAFVLGLMNLVKNSDRKIRKLHKDKH